MHTNLHKYFGQDYRIYRDKGFYHEGTKVHEGLTEIMVFFSSWFFVPSWRARIEQFSFKTCGYLAAKIWEFENSLIYSSIRTYGENAVYNYVEFRSIRACCFNYRGAPIARLSSRQDNRINRVKDRRQKA